jgi:hypothetical protein
LAIFVAKKSGEAPGVSRNKISDDDRGYGLGGGFVAEPSFWAMVSVRSYYAALDRQAAVASSA